MTKEKNIKAIFIGDHVRVDGVIRVPEHIRPSDYINRHDNLLPVHQAVYTLNTTCDVIQEADFAMLNTSLFHSIIPVDGPINVYKYSKHAKVGEIMSPKVHAVSSEARLKTAYQKMLKYNVHHMPVIKEKSFIGIIVKDDIEHLIESEGDNVIEAYVKEQVQSAQTQDDFFKTIRMMLKNKVTAIPVLEGTKVVGIVTERDLFKYVYKDIFEE